MTPIPIIAEGVRRAGRALEEAGYDVEEVDPPRVLDTYLALGELMTTSLTDVPVPLDTVMGPDAIRFLDLSTADFAVAASDALLHRTRFRIARAWREFFTTYPLIVGPTWAQPQFPLGFDIRDKESAH